MDEAPRIGPDMRDLMATVGELLLLWGFLESEIRQRISSIEADDSKSSKDSVLTRWRNMEKLTRPNDSSLAQLFADIEEVAAIRNCIAHGLTSASANPWSSEEAKVVCVMPNGSHRNITLLEMTEAKNRLHSLANRIRNL
jgi:hypothetical protein